MISEYEDEQYKDDQDIMNVLTNKLKSRQESYISKEKFIEMISCLDFKYIQSARIYFITGFEIDIDKQVIKEYSYNIEID